nr:MAG: RNA replicase beta chain [Sanya fiers-like virus 28]
MPFQVQPKDRTVPSQGQLPSRKVSLNKKRKDPTISCFVRFLGDVDSHVSRAALSAIKADRHADLLKIDVNPRDYDNGEAFRLDYQVSKFLSKYKGLRTGIDTKAVARAAWSAAERRCAQTNAEISAWTRGEFNFHPAVERVIILAQRKIAQVLSLRECASGLHIEDMKDIFSTCRWGPGVTSSLDGKRSTLAHKIREDQISTTRRAAKYFTAVVSGDPHFNAARFGDTYSMQPVSLLQNNFQFVEGSVTTFVPKNAKTDRSIEKMPTANIFLQLGVGSFLRRKLRRVGIDLDTQENNQLAAKLAYRDNLATVDLQSASDTISRELVWLLLPVDFATLLDDIRCSRTKERDQWVDLQKWSAMGNGYTFELETLIFWGLASAVADSLNCPSTVWVYGDDIVCDARAYPLLKEVFTAVGFTVNSEKTFSDGKFYESCGKHYFAGVDVTPLYCKEQVLSEDELIRFANRLYRFSKKYFCKSLWKAYTSLFEDKDICETAKTYYIPDRLRYGPGDGILNESDSGFLVPPHRIDTTGLKLGAWGWKFPVLRFRPKLVDEAQLFADHSATYREALRVGSETPSKGCVTPRLKGYFQKRFCQYLI